MSDATAPSPQPDATLSVNDGLRLDYQQTTDFLRTLTDVRFKLLALVPTLSGAAIALLGHPSSAIQLLALGLLGLFATLGILLYELRNSQLYDYAIRRAEQIEIALELPPLGSDAQAGGLFSDRPKASLRLFGLASVNRDSGLALVYSAALAGWSYLVAWGALRAAHVSDARPIGAAIGVVVGLIVLAELVRIRERPHDVHASQAIAAAPAER